MNSNVRAWKQLFSYLRGFLGKVRWKAHTEAHKTADCLKWWFVKRELAALCPQEIHATRLKNLAQAFEITETKVNQYVDEIIADSRFLDQYNATRQALPPHIDKSTASLADCITAYVVVRLSKPEVMVETGVHCGGLTAFVLRAMDRSDAGTLYSIDKPMPGLPPLGELHGQGCLVPSDFRDRWHLINGDSERDLPALLVRLGAIDLFNHDSLHAFDFMTMEYETAWSFLRPGGVLMSHDVRINRAFQTFHEKHQASIVHRSVIYGMGIIRRRADDPS